MKTDFYTTHKNIFDNFITTAIEEDLGSGDHSGLACIDSNAKQKAQLVVKQDCVIAGVELAKALFKHYDPKITFKPFYTDGDSLKETDKVFEVIGPARSLLSMERLVLNCMQRMSGIATTTKKFCEKIRHTNCVLLDTRKTTPNFRYPEKWAVLIGGGINHRMGLFDAVMIKDNHIDYCGGLPQALKKTRTYLNNLGQPLDVIVETRTKTEVQQALEFPWLKRILLDNMSLPALSEALELINGVLPSEASGNINASNLLDYAETGVNFISMGLITHSALPIDLSIKAL